MVKCDTNNISRIENEIKNLGDELLVIAFFFIPFLKFSPVASGFIVLYSFISIVTYFYKNRTWGGVRFNPVTGLILAYTLYTIISSLFVAQEIRPFVRLVMEIRLPLLLMSIAFIFRDVVPIHLHRVLRAFALGAIASAVVASVVYIFSLFTAFENIPYTFFNLQFCFMGVVSLISHRTYFCFNLISSLIIFYYLYSGGWTKRRVIRFLLLTLFVSGIVFLSDARISLITLLWVVFFVVSREVKRHFGGYIFLFFIGLVSVLCVFVIFQNNRINDIFLTLCRDSVALKDLDPRFAIWDCGWSCYSASSHPWVGTGAGSSPEILMEEYRRVEFWHAIDSHWGMHNQFLEVLLESGVIGLLLLMAALVIPLTQKGPLRLFYWIWIPALCLNLLFESMLTRSIGTYPITTIWILAGVAEGKSLNRAMLLFRRILWALIGFAIVVCSVKYIRKDKKELFSGFQRGFERVEVLPGQLPDELIGCYGLRIDSTTMSDTWRNWAMMYHRVGQQKMEENDTLTFSVYFYASEDFNADELSIRLEERKQRSREEFYDLSRKGTWQKLTISDRGLYGNTVFLVYCRKKDAENFDNMNGFAIFAKPIITVHQ